MRLEMTGLGRIETRRSEKIKPPEGMVRLHVNYCGVCRTDAKMWHEGHRDLVLPRVPGHEIAAVDDAGQSVTVWPATACGQCAYCASGRENLCESMKIMGFHYDGGFSDTVVVPVDSLIHVPDGIPPHLVCFAEPVGCVLNALEKLDLEPPQRVIIFGGGTVGLLAAWIVRTLGHTPLVIEKQARKIEKAAPFLESASIACRQQTDDSAFDAVVNACPDHTAFCQGITKLAKGGRYAFFSGLAKNEHIETNLINLLHYKEVAVYGAYGLTRDHMRRTLDLIAEHAATLEHLVEAVIPPGKLEEILPEVLAGEAFKYILNCNLNGGNTVSGRPVGKTVAETMSQPELAAAEQSLFRQIRASISPVDTGLLAAARQKIDSKTKPLGALGRLEDLAVQACLIQKTLSPQLENKALFVFAGDHGVAEEGISAYPSEVTAQMVANFLDGGAAINVLCRHHHIDMRIVDMGVNAEIAPHAKLVDKKVRRGTRNFALEPAMTREEAIQALEAGMACFLDLRNQKPIHLVGLGEMGIGNTTSAAAIISAATGISPHQATGRGTGIDDEGVRHKIKVIEKALAFHRPDSGDGLDLLGKVGGFEIAGIAGAALAAASNGTVVVLDGVISTAAGLIAHLIQPDIGGYLVSGHRSVEPAQQAALERMGLEPIIDLGMRLGEGTGAALAMNFVAAACRIMREMASFDEAGVSGKE
jgi:nicotinate-nucleotide--dimethylbenzimidazole phosphoribosyltransferase